MSANEVFRKNLSAEMERQGLSAYRLAQISGVSQSLISAILRSNRGVSLRTVDALAFGLNKRPHQLIMPRPGVAA